ncbi:hypothetical protein KKHLCK_15955 [Candidatus Electrothrix laxa]
MQLKRKTKRGNFTAAILLTGCFMLTTANAEMAEGTKIQLDFTKIQQALKKGATASGGAAAPAPGMSTGQLSANTAAPAVNAPAPTTNGMQPGPAVIGMMDEEMSKMMEKTMGETFVSSNLMAEMQKKIMAENMGSMQESIQASMMKNMQGSIQQAPTNSLTK